MFVFRFLLIFIFFSIFLFASIIKIDESTNSIEILPQSEIYIDDTKQLTFDKVKKIDFKENNKILLGYGYSPNFNVWVRFTLKNTSNKTINKILEYDNAISTHIEFYNPNNNYKKELEGLFNINKNRKTINPTFNIQLEPFSEKTYYIKTSSTITPLILKLDLWKNSSFYKKEIKHQLYLGLFFGAMLVLIFYNVFVFFFTKDISYFFYVLYLVSLSIHHVLYVGVAQIYLLNQGQTVLAVTYATIVVFMPIFFLGLFLKIFLNVKQYPIWNIIFNIFLVSLLTLLFLFFIIDLNDGLVYGALVLFLIFSFVVTIYSSFKKNRQAYFVLLTWFIILIGWGLMYLSSAGFFDVHESLPYLIEFILVFEGVVFSIALADRINQLQTQKSISDKKLISQQQSEEKRLKIEVKNKTKDLTKALDEKDLLLDEKELLFKELHHRVKNNMQMVVSMIRLQSKRVDDERLKTIFQTAQNRINTMAHLHELLYKQENITHIDTLEYFTLIIDELQETTNKDITINYNIKTDLKMEQAIYCGLILNELISNALKYAFEEKGMIDISLIKDENSFVLIVHDDGKGFDKDRQIDSLGLILVNTLATRQLKGTIDFQSNQGTLVKIIWKNNE